MTTHTRNRGTRWVKVVALSAAMATAGARAAERSGARATGPAPASATARAGSASPAATPEPVSPERAAARRAVVSSVRALTTGERASGTTGTGASDATPVTLPSGERLRRVPFRGAQVVIATRRADGTLATTCVGSADAAERFLASPPAGPQQ